MAKVDVKQLSKVISGTVAGAVALAAVTAAGWEGLKTKAYRDAIGIPTVCIGETLHVKMGDEYTPEQCYKMFGVRIQAFSDGIDKCLVKPDALPDKVRASFISLSYNIGVGAFCQSTVHRKANEGKLREACNAILLYNRANKKVLLGLVNRRQAEQALCLEGLTP